MNKKLPGVFQNKINKKINNNESVFYGRKSEIEMDRKDRVIGKNINQKISDIFNSIKYVYKIDVLITTKDGKEVKTLIGKNYNSLITIDNEIIPISNIIDIEIK